MTSPVISHMMSPILDDEMRVMKRSGSYETVSFDKILKRIKKIGQEDDIKVNYTSLAMKVIDQLYDGISTTKIDELTAEQCASLSSTHPDYNVLAGRIVVSNHQKNTCASFVEVMRELHGYLDKHGKPSPLVSDDLFAVVNEYGDILEEMCVYSRDYFIDYFGFKTLERSYLMKINGKTVERPQHMWLRVAIGIHGDNISRVKETYDLMSKKYFTHATPTLFNAGTPRPQLSSCYLIAMESDSIDGIYNTLKDCALISKLAGGIGLHIHNVRATGSHIRGTNGTSNGIVPMLRVFNNTAKYVDQCVHPDTIIYSTGQPMPIKQCVSQETEIFNMTGGTEVISSVLEHFYEGPILEFELENCSESLKITPMHPMYALRKDDEFYRDQYQWIDAGLLKEGDHIVYSVPKYVKDILSISNEDCHFYALFLIFGSINETGDYMLSIPTTNTLDYTFVTNYLSSRAVYYSVLDLDAENVYMIKWNPSLHLPFRYSDFYNSAGDKHIHSRWLHLPCSKLTDFINCFIMHSQYSSLSTPAVVKRGLDFIKMKMENDGQQFFTKKIKNIQSSEYKGLLYDLQMESEHNYLLESGLVHNGGGKRNGSFAIYLEPWHADIEMFLQMRKNHGDEELKARDLFYALWIPDLFMERVKANGSWTLMCPDECPGLADVFGDDFKTLYEKYEVEGKGRSVIQARDLWFKILDAQMETGTPYMLFKDSVNKKSNQKNVGIIKSSNLCCEITEYSDENETAVCNLASIGLPTFVKTGDSGSTFFDYELLHSVTKTVAYNLNRIIDVNYYPTEKTRKSNLRHRPIGIGVQGLADVFILLGHPFHSNEAKVINKHIFETIYHAALEQSCELAGIEGPYETFRGSPSSEGKLQFDLWSVNPGNERYDWTALKMRIMEIGLRNSLLVAPMPTASTSQILGFNECIEPITSNIYSRRTNAGDFIQVNKYMMMDLIKLNLWNEKIKNNIIANNGSIQHLDMIPDEIKHKYKTVWEISMRDLIDMAADRGAFICQSQSLNLWIEDPNYNTLTAMHFHSWTKGLKTGIYYLRRRGRHQAQQFTIEPEKSSNSNGSNEELYEDDSICEMCSS